MVGDPRPQFPTHPNPVAVDKKPEDQFSRARREYGSLLFVHDKAFRPQLLSRCHDYIHGSSTVESIYRREDKIICIASVHESMVGCEIGQLQVQSVSYEIGQCPACRSTLREKTEQRSPVNSNCRIFRGRSVAFWIKVVYMTCVPCADSGHLKRHQWLVTSPCEYRVSLSLIDRWKESLGYLQLYDPLRA